MGYAAATAKVAAATAQSACLPTKLMALLRHDKGRWLTTLSAPGFDLQMPVHVRGLLGHTPRGSCDNSLLRRVLRRFSRLLSTRFQEGFLEGVLQWVLKGGRVPRRVLRGVLRRGCREGA